MQAVLKVLSFADWSSFDDDLNKLAEKMRTYRVRRIAVRLYEQSDIREMQAGKPLPERTKKPVV